MRNWYHVPETTSLDELRDQASKDLRRNSETIVIHFHKFEGSCSLVQTVLSHGKAESDEYHEVHRGKD